MARIGDKGYWRNLHLIRAGIKFVRSLVVLTYLKINGIRITDKSRGDLSVRLEIWVKFDKDQETKLALEFESGLADFLKENEGKVKVHFSKIQYKSHK